MLKRYLPALVAALLVPYAVPLAFAHGDDDDDDRGINLRVSLARPDPPVDPDADGHVHLQESADRSAIHVHVNDLERGATFDVKISRGATTEEMGKITIPPPKPPTRFQAVLNGAQEVPPVTTEATGTGKFIIIGRTQTTLYYKVRVEGLSGPMTAAHIHIGDVGADGDVVYPLDDDLHGMLKITEEDRANLAAGKYYVNVHTAANPDGEVRGQITPKVSDPPRVDKGGSGKLKIDTARGDTLPLGATSVADLSGSTVSVVNSAGATVLSARIDIPKPGPRCFSAVLNGAQEAPPVTTDATGTAKVFLLGRNREMLCYSVRVRGLSGPVRAAHIHQGAVGVDGPVVHPLDHEDLRGCIRVSAQDLENLDAGNWYVNVHTEANPDGEIRGQLLPCPARPPDDDDGDDDDDHGGRGDDDDDDDDDGDTPPPPPPAGARSLWSWPSAPAGSRSGGSSSEDSAADSLEWETFMDDFPFALEGTHDASFQRGDVDQDGRFNITDVVSTLWILFRGNAMPYCQDTLDSNDDGKINIGDPITMLSSLFSGGGPLPPPSSPDRAGFDPTGDELFCEDE